MNQKSILLSIMVLFMTNTLIAQEFKFAPEAGMNHQVRISNSAFDYNSNLTLGINATVEMCKKMSHNTSIYYNQTVFSAKENTPLSFNQVDAKSIQLQHNLAYNFDSKCGKISLFAGPFADYKVYAKTSNFTRSSEMSEEAVYTSEKYEFSKGGIKRFNYGLNAGVKYELPFGLYFKAGYNQYLRKSSPQFECANSVITTTVGFNLFSKKCSAGSDNKAEEI